VATIETCKRTCGAHLSEDGASSKWEDEIIFLVRFFYAVGIEPVQKVIRKWYHYL